MSETALILDTQSDRIGGGELTFSRVGAKTVVTRAEARSPLRLLTPVNAGSSAAAAWAFTSSYGGGLLAGDDISLEVKVEAGAVGYISSQSSTKVYRSADGRTSQQSLGVQVEEEAFLAVMPEPVVCFAEARYEQRQRIDLAASGGLVLLDWFTSGRHGCGERWQASRLRTSNEVWMEGKCMLRDVLHLDAPVLDAREEGMEPGMGEFNCFATLVMLGRSLTQPAKELLAWVNEIPVKAHDMLPMGASPLAEGVIFRIAGINIEQVGRLLFDRLAFLGGDAFLGERPWKRKW